MSESNDSKTDELLTTEKNMRGHALFRTSYAFLLSTGSYKAFVTKQEKISEVKKCQSKKLFILL